MCGPGRPLYNVEILVPLCTRHFEVQEFIWLLRTKMLLDVTAGVWYLAWLLPVWLFGALTGYLVSLILSPASGCSSLSTFLTAPGVANRCLGHS